MDFIEWLGKLAEVTKKNLDWTESVRHDYYEGQPDTWREYYDEGHSPEEAFYSDASYWDE